MTHPADDIQKTIIDLIEQRVGEEAADWFEEILFQLREMGDDTPRHELVRLMQKWVAST